MLYCAGCILIFLSSSYSFSLISYPPAFCFLSWSCCRSLSRLFMPVAFLVFYKSFSLSFSAHLCFFTLFLLSTIMSSSSSHIVRCLYRNLGQRFPVLSHFPVNALRCQFLLLAQLVSIFALFEFLSSCFLTHFFLPSNLGFVLTHLHISWFPFSLRPHSLCFASSPSLFFYLPFVSGFPSSPVAFEHGSSPVSLLARCLASNFLFSSRVPCIFSLLAICPYSLLLLHIVDLMFSSLLTSLCPASCLVSSLFSCWFFLFFSCSLLLFLGCLLIAPFFKSSILSGLFLTPCILACLRFTFLILVLSELLSSLRSNLSSLLFDPVFHPLCVFSA